MLPGLVTKTMAVCPPVSAAGPEHGWLLVTGTDVLLNGTYITFDLVGFISGKLMSSTD